MQRATTPIASPCQATRPGGLCRPLPQCVTGRRMSLLCMNSAVAEPASSLASSHGNGVHTAGVVIATPPMPVQAASPQPAAPPLAPPALLPPAAAYENVAKMGAAKAEMPVWKTLTLGILAGFYISFGGFMAVTCATMVQGMGLTNPIFSRFIMGATFPFGLLITLVCGAELYTGNTAFVAAAVYEKKTTWKNLFKNWTWSYIGNFIGSLALVALVVGSGVLATSGVAQNMAVAKTSIPWIQAFLRGIMCNWLVCSAVWMASASSTLPGKMLAAYLPVMAFITMGLEHSVANMFFVSLGIAQGAPVSWGSFVLNNLVPVTLGNTLAGAVCMALSYAVTFGALGNKPKPAAAAA